MGYDAIGEALPGYAKDLHQNLRVITTSSLEPVAAYGAAYAAALVAGNEDLIRAAEEEAHAHLDPDQMEGARSAAAIMSMNNVWYKFTDVVTDSEVKALPAKLRMNVMMTHGGVDVALFEAWSLAVSVVNTCGTCINAHSTQMRKAGMTVQNVVDLGRIAAVVKAIADTMNFESPRSS